MSDFSDWLAVAHVTDDPVGDMVCDMRDDKIAPRDFSNQDELVCYLRDRLACREAIETVPAFWKRYEAWKRTRGKKGLAA